MILQKIFFFSILLRRSYGETSKLKNIFLDINENLDYKSSYTLYGIWNNASYRILFNDVSTKFVKEQSDTFCEHLNYAKGQYFSKLEFIKANSYEPTVKLIESEPCCEL